MASLIAPPQTPEPVFWITFLEASAPGLIIGLVSALASAILTTRMALQRFRAEQWWSRKATAYVEILEALFKVKAYVDGRLWAQMSAEALMPPDEERLRVASKEGYEALLRASAVGALFIGAEARSCVEKALTLARESRLPESYGLYDDVSSTLDMAIDELRRIAHAELKASARP